jgi:hypothetical protein
MAGANVSLPQAALEQFSAVQHVEVQAILASPTFVAHHRLETVAHPEVIRRLLDYPDITSGLARALHLAPTRLWRVGPGRYQGNDGEWNSGTLEVLWAEGDRRVFLEQGVSRGWWFGDVGGRVVAAMQISQEAERTRGEVEVWARIDAGVLDRVLRMTAPLLKGFLSRKLDEQFGMTFRVAEYATRDPVRFCDLLAVLSDGLFTERQSLAGVAGCPGTRN